MRATKQRDYSLESVFNLAKNYLDQVDPNQHHIVSICQDHFQQKGMSLGGIDVRKEY